MRHVLTLSICLFSFLMMGVGGASSTERLEMFEFGTVDQPTGAFIQTDLISVQKGRTFGWKMKFKTDAKRVRVKEVLTLPAPSQHWTVGGSTTVSFDKRIGTTIYERDVSEGVLDTSQFWSWVPGDPFGAHVVSVYVDDKLIKTARFDIAP